MGQENITDKDQQHTETNQAVGHAMIPCQDKTKHNEQEAGNHHSNAQTLGGLGNTFF